MVDCNNNIIEIGDLVMLKFAKIRGPSGILRKLEESPDYGVVLDVFEKDFSTGKTKGVPDFRYCRIKWFDCASGARRGEKETTVEAYFDLEKISK
jgi:hypothetical protein